MYRTVFTLTIAGLAAATLLAGCGGARQDDSSVLVADSPAATSGETCADYLDLVDGLADPLLMTSC
jgi:hypothetical protein